MDLELALTIITTFVDLIPVRSVVRQTREQLTVCAHRVGLRGSRAEALFRYDAPGSASHCPRTPTTTATPSADRQLLQSIQPIDAFVFDEIAGLTQLQVDHADALVLMPLDQRDVPLAQAHVAIRSRLLAQAESIPCSSPISVVEQRSARQRSPKSNLGIELRFSPRALISACD